jgi:hypothetical protein
MVPRNDGGGSAYVPGSAKIDEALIVRKAIGNLFRHGDPSRLDLMEKKSLTSFSFGSNAFILPPAMSDQVLSCVTRARDPALWFDFVATMLLGELCKHDPEVRDRLRAAAAA